MTRILGELRWGWRHHTVQEVVAGGKGTRIVSARDFAKEEAEAEFGKDE